MNTEECAQIRKTAAERGDHKILALLDEVDRLTEERNELWQLQIATGKKLMRAEADLAELNRQTVALNSENRNLRDALADEKWRHAELRAGVAALADQWDGLLRKGFGIGDKYAEKHGANLRALLDTATEETP